MTLGEIVRLFDGQPSEKHSIEVDLDDVRRWFQDQQAIMEVNNELRRAMLQFKDTINQLVK